MAREFSRTQRIAEQLQRELAQLIQQEVKDPRLGLVTVSGAKVSRDLSYADIYVTVMGNEEAQAQAEVSVKILNRAAGFLRGRVAQAIKMRVVPQLRFHYDASVMRGNYMSSLIEQAVSEDKQRQGDRGDAGADSASEGSTDNHGGEG
ncbi:30S ribosome-binding factor RbfA [Motiliproteus sp.]|uniref:30S ribosome-binding factor RbfA n=1 Tax=Motiliproteus sp. TaxID=1898955 RepID=UPI003BA979E8